MQRKLFLPIFLSIILLLTGCKKTDLTPSFLYITEDDLNNCVDVSAFNADHDLNFDIEQLNDLTKHSFSHVNVYVNNKNLGCWQLPCKVPVLHTSATDSATVVLLPAFRKTGMNRTISGYPFFNVLRKKKLLVPGETYNVSDDPPVYKYSPYATVKKLWTFITSSPFSPTDTSYSTQCFYPNEGVGQIVLGDNDKFDVISTPIERLPVYNHYVYLEITYKIENNIDVGLKISTGSSPNAVHQIGGIYPSNGEWKTIYFDISSIIFAYNYTGASVTTANIVLSGNSKPNLPSTHFEIDNIKVIYQPAS